MTDQSLTEKKGEQLLQQINSKTGGAFEAFLIENNLCPLCASDLKERTGEKVCLNCGFARNSIHFRSSIPINETRTPENYLAYNKGLGNTLGEKGLFCVLAHSIGTKDLPIRAKQINIITQKWEHPKILTMKKLGRNLAHQWGFDNHKENRSIIFSNYFGRMLKKIGAYMVLAGINASLKQIVNACFVLSLRQIVGLEAYQKAIIKLNVSESLIVEIENTLQLLLKGGKN